MDVLTASEVGRVLLFVAPGYFAIQAYEHRFPQRPATGNFGEFVPAVAASVPLVAFADVIRKKLDWNRDPLSLKYVALLLGVSLLAGYLAAVFRDADWVRSLLARAGLRQEPESSVLEQVMRSLDDEEAQLTVTLRDGEVLAGTPAHWASDPEAKMREIYLTNARWYSKESKGWEEPRADGGVLINVSDVISIEVKPHS